MNNNPLVSIIVPTYNRPTSLTKALQSAVLQTYTKIEIIVVNDAGIDVTQIIETFNDHRIFYIQHSENKGIAATRNTALKLAKGSFIAYLDDDDIYYPNHIQTLINGLLNSSFDVAYSDSKWIYKRDENNQSIIYKKKEHCITVDFDHLIVENLLPPLNVMHKKSCLDKVGLFDESLKVYEDTDLWLRLVAKYPFLHIPTVTCEYSKKTGYSQLTGLWAGFYLEIIQRLHFHYRDLINKKPSLIKATKERREKLERLAISQLENMNDNEVEKLLSTKVMQNIAQGSLAISHDDIRGARALCGYFTQRLPENAEMWFILSRLSRIIKDYQLAGIAIDKALKIQETKETLEELVQILEEIGVLDEAQKIKEYVHSKYGEQGSNK